MTIQKTLINAVLFSTLMAGCQSDFQVNIEDLNGISSTETGGLPETSSEGSETGDSGEEAGDGDGDEEGTTGDGDGDSNGDGDSTIQPGEPCDPIAAFKGEAPCADGPEGTYTCAAYPVPFNPDELGYFCVPLIDSDNDGGDLKDNCADDEQGNPYPSYRQTCLNSACAGQAMLPVGYCTPPATVSDPDPDPYDRCCTMRCDADNPCDSGFKCLYNHNPDFSKDGVPGFQLGWCVDENWGSN